MAAERPPHPRDETEQLALREVRELLREYLAVAESAELSAVVPRSGLADFVLRGGTWTFVCEVKASARTAQIVQAAIQVRAAASALDGVPLVVVPFMGVGGAELCRELGVHWIDLSGNARIAVPGLHVHVSGQPNRFPERGRPPTPFGSRGSRLARALLADPGRSWTQVELATESGLDAGTVSRLVRRLVDDGHLAREDRQVRVVDAHSLIRAWREDARAAASRWGAVSGDDSAPGPGLGLRRTVPGAQPLRGVRELANEGGEWAAAGSTACQILLGLDLVAPLTVTVTRPIDIESMHGWVAAPFGEAEVWLTVAEDAGILHGAAPTTPLPTVSWPDAVVRAALEPDPGPELAARLISHVLDQDDGPGGPRSGEGASS